MKNHGPIPKRRVKKRKVAKYGPKLRSLEERFLAKLRRSGDCIVFTGATNGDGYGMLYDRDTGKKELAHRVAHRLAHGKYPAGTMRHTCDNPACVNLVHLVEGTQAENMQDMARKRRSANQHPPASLRQAKKAVKLYDRGFSQMEIAGVTGLHQTTISRIVRGEVAGLPVVAERALRRRAFKE